MITYEVRPWHFFIPFVLGLIGGYLQHNNIWSPGGWVFAYASAAGCIAWMLLLTYWTNRANLHAWEAHKIETYMKLDPDQRIEMGYRKAAPRLTVETNYKESNGFIVRSSYDWIPWSEGNFQQWVIAILRGVSPAFRNWEGSGRLFKDGEYESGVAKLIELGYLAKNGTASNSKVIVTRPGVEVFVKYLEDWGIPYELSQEFEGWMTAEG